eukprot:s7891_g1.t1
MGPMREPGRDVGGGRGEPSPATDRTDAPLVAKSDTGPAAAGGSGSSSFGFSELLSSGFKVVQCCGLPALAQEGHSLHRTFQLAVSLKAPPGGWLGPFGFFRLVTYTFLAGVLLALLLALLASTGLQTKLPLLGAFGPDGFAASGQDGQESCDFEGPFAFELWALLGLRLLAVRSPETERRINTTEPGCIIQLHITACFVVVIMVSQLCFACFVCAGAAYAHEGLEQEVAAMKKQNGLFQEKNAMMAAQLSELGDVRKKLEEVKEHLGQDLGHFEARTEWSQSQEVAECECKTKKKLREDARLTDEELDDFFEVCKLALQQAAPDFDMDKLETEVRSVGLGLCNLRFLTNATVAGCDPVPGRSSAMLALVLFSSHPEKYEHELCIALKSVLQDEAKVDGWIQAKKAKAKPQEQGRIPGHELMDLAREVMSAALEKEKEEGTRAPSLAEPGRAGPSRVQKASRGPSPAPVTPPGPAQAAVAAVVVPEPGRLPLDWRRGDRCSVWSNSAQRWCDGEVVNLAERATEKVPQGSVEVAFELGRKWIAPSDLGRALSRR